MEEGVNIKSGFVSYVLVCDTSHSNDLWYYRGFYIAGLPQNSTKFVEAMKIPFKDEAQIICDEMNKQSTSQLKNAFKYHVEEHAYI